MSETANHQRVPADSAKDPVGWTRRRLLAGLASLTGAISLGLPLAAVARAATPATSRGELSDCDLRIAALASDLAASDPEEAERITRWVESQLPARSRLSSPRQRARLARKALLEPDRVTRDFEREEIMVLDGWVLSRSEGSAAVYLNSLARSCGQRPAR